jgi:hypothetical protein
MECDRKPKVYQNTTDGNGFVSESSLRPRLQTIDLNRLSLSSAVMPHFTADQSA